MLVFYEDIEGRERHRHQICSYILLDGKVFDSLYLIEVGLQQIIFIVN